MASRWQVLNVYSVVLALQLMFATPVEGSIMNAMAAEQLQADPKLFEQHVRDTLQGGQYFGLDFICNMADGEGMAIQTHQRSWAPAERHSDHMHKVPPSLPPSLSPSLQPDQASACSFAHGVFGSHRPCRPRSHCWRSARAVTSTWT